MVLKKEVARYPALGSLGSAEQLGLQGTELRVRQAVH